MDADSSSSSTPPPSLPKSSSRKIIASGENRHPSSEPLTSPDRRSKRRSKDAIAGSIKDLARLLGYQEREVKELQRMLYTVTEQLKTEKQRAESADRKALEAAHRFRNADNARIIAEQNATRTNEELRLYKVQLESAQKEIYRAQEVLSTVEHQRQEAEEEAARARTTARALKEEKLVQVAREEGRRLGLEEGIQRGRDLGYQEGRAEGYEQGRSRAEDMMSRMFYDEHGSPISQTPMHYSPPSSRHTLHVPPDNWIPERDTDARIRLPPPHEMTRPPMSRSPSPPLPPVPLEDRNDNEEGEGSPALMIPAPNRHFMDHGYGSDAPLRPPRLPRRSSSPTSESSTRTSELEMLSVPPQYVSRRYDGDRLSVIPEANSAEGTPSQQTMRTSSTPVVQRQPSISEFVHVPSPRTADPQTSDYYRRPRSPSEASTHRSQGHSNNNTPNDRLSRSSSLNSVPEISIEPPSRPQSNSSREALNTGSNFLSPADADRPIPLPSAPPPIASSRGPTASTPATGATIPIVLPDGQLPPGFIPSGPSLPATPASRLGPGTSSKDQIPGSFPSMADQYMSLSSRRSFRDLSPVDPVADGPISQPTTMPVIPPPSSKYPHLDDDDEDVASSSSSSANTLTTPPPRRLRIRRRASASPYAAASVPPGVVYPHGIESIGIPVPPPGSGSGGSGTPRSSNAREGGSYTTPRMLNTALRPSESKQSLHSSKSHKHFDKEGYLDPAFLASSSAEDVNAGVGRSRW